jgi:inner membrane protein
MDSLTQVTLGAAVGELVLGRKLGNRAMVWGAVAGTIPDLDVISNLVTDDISALAFHRAITHSFAFAVLAAPILGRLLDRMDGHRGSFFSRERIRDFGSSWVLIFALLSLGSIRMPIPWQEILKISAVVSIAILGFPLLSGFRASLNGMPRAESERPGFRMWTWFFFWSIVTHPLLDACTTYGTQLFQPFSDYRAAINNISVVDPIYTLPFLICVIIASRLAKGGKWRIIINGFGIALSSLYLIISMIHKHKVDHIFEKSLNAREIQTERYLTSPTIFNNILWQGIAEGDTAYYYGLYSLLDKRPVVDSFVVIPKHHEWLTPYATHRSVRVLKWFSDGYYMVFKRQDGRMQFSDLRFGTMTGRFEGERDMVFGFILEERDGVLVATSTDERPTEAGEGLRQLWQRMLGRD